MIFVTGDVHGDWMRRLNTRAFFEQKELGLTKDAYVLILGDFGIWDNSKEEKHNLDWLESKPFTTLFIDGNHENYDILDALPVEEWQGGRGASGGSKADDGSANPLMQTKWMKALETLNEWATKWISS